MHELGAQALTSAVIVGLAAWRVGHLLAIESGPGDVFEHLRRLLGVPKTGEIQGFFPKLITCVWCNTVWLAAGAWAVVAAGVPGAAFTVTLIAGVGIAALLHATVDRLER